MHAPSRTGAAQNGAKEGPVSAGGAKSGAFPGVDLQLVALIQAWATLSKEIQQQIMLLLEG